MVDRIKQNHKTGHIIVEKLLIFNNPLRGLFYTHFFFIPNYCCRTNIQTYKPFCDYTTLSGWIQLDPCFDQVPPLGVICVATTFPARVSPTVPFIVHFVISLLSRSRTCNGETVHED